MSENKHRIRKVASTTAPAYDDQIHNDFNEDRDIFSDSPREPEFEFSNGDIPGKSQYSYPSGDLNEPVA